MAQFLAPGYGKRLLTLLAGVGLMAATPPVMHAQREIPRSGEQWQVIINGEYLGLSRVVNRRIGGSAAYIRVDDLKRAVDGDLAPGRLRVDGSALLAAAEGRCRTCRIRVARPVVITGAVRQIRGELYLPLADLVRALEGRLVINTPERRFAIHAGKCDWCILEPTN